MIILDKTVISATEPPWTTVLWVKLLEDGVALYTFLDGRWKPMKLVNDKNTPSIEDDEVADISNIGQVVQDEVTRQLENYDSDVNDTHNAPSSDDSDYPDLTLY